MLQHLPFWKKALPLSFLILSFFEKNQALGAACTWTGGVTGNWNVPTNWSCGAVPGPGDDVTIPGGVTVTLDADASVASVSLLGTTALVLNFNLTTSGNFGFTGTGSVSGAGGLTIGGDLTWVNNCSMGGAGAFSLAGGVVSSTDGTLTFSRGALVPGAGGSLSGGAEIKLANSSPMTLSAGKTLLIKGSSSINDDGTACSFTNNGTVSTAGGTGIAAISTPTTNNGTYDVSGSNLYHTGLAAATSTHTGATITIASGRTFQISSSAIHNFVSTSIGGAGTFKLSNSTSTVNINSGTILTMATFLVVGGTVNLNAAQTLPSFTSSSGTCTLSLNANLIVSGDFTFQYPNSLVTGAGDLSIGGNFLWGGGKIEGAGAFSLAGSLNSSSTGTLNFLRSTLLLTSGGSLSNNNLNMPTGTTLTIPAGKTLTLLNNSDITGNNSSTQVINNGTIQTGGAGASTITFLTLTNNGAIAVAGANLVFSGSATSNTTHTGATITVASGASLEFLAGTHLFNDNTAVSGAGTFKPGGSTTSVTFNSGSTLSAATVNVSQGSLTLNVAQAFTNLSVTGTLTLNQNLTASGSTSITNGTITGSGDLSIAALNWQGGTISGSGAFSMTGTMTSGTNLCTFSRASLSLPMGGSVASTLRMTGGAPLTLPAGQTLTLTGTIDQTGGATTFTNNGTIDVTGAQSRFIKVGSFVNNGGTLNVSGVFLYIDGGAGSTSTHTGATINVTAGNELNFLSGEHFFNNNSSVTGAGKLTTGSKTTFSSGSTLTTATNEIGADLVLNTAQTAPSMYIGGSTTTATLNADLTVTGTLTLDRATITGSGNITCNGDFAFTAGPGTVSGGGSFSLAGALLGSSNGTCNFSRTALVLSNGGSLSSAALKMLSGSVLTLPASKTLTLSGATIEGDGATSTFINHGTIATGTSSSTITKLTTTNDGTLNISGGNLTFSGTTNSASTHEGTTVAIASGRSLIFNNSTGPIAHNFNNNSAVSGAGTFQISGAGSVVTFNSGSTLSPAIVNTTAGELILNSAQTWPTLTLSNLELTINAPLTVTGNAAISGSSALLTGAGSLDIQGNLTWSGGTITGTGTFTLGGTLTASGTLNFSRPALVMASGGSLAGAINLSNGAAMSLPAGKTLTTSGTSTIDGAGGATTFTNNGTITTGGASGQWLTFQDNTVTNNGTINVDGTGVMFTNSANSNSVHTGATINVASGRIFSLDNATHDFNGTTITGAGTFRTNGSAAVANFNSGSTLNTTAVNGVLGTININIAMTIPALNLSGGDVNLAQNLTISGAVSMSSVNSVIGGTGNLEIGGDLTWTNGTVSGNGTFTLAGVLTCTTGVATLITRSLAMPLGGTWNNASILMQSGATMTLPAGQTLTINNSSTEELDGGTFVNNGTVVKTGAGTFQVTSNLWDNNHNVTLSAGKLEFTTGASSTNDNAAWTLASGTEALFGGTTHHIANSSFTGAGTFKVGNTSSSAQTVYFDGGNTISTPLSVVGGDISVTAATTVPSLTCSSTASLDIDLGADLTITGDATLYLNNATGGGVKNTGALSIGGNLLWQGGTISGAGGAFNLTGTFTVGTATSSSKLGRSVSLTSGGTIGSNLAFENAAVLTIPSGKTLTLSPLIPRSFTGNGTVANNGTFVKASSSNYSFTGTGATLTYTAGAGSTTDIQAGTLIFNGNAIYTNAPTAVTKGTGTLSISGAATPTFGTFSPGSSPGTLNITGNYVNPVGSTLDIEIVNGSPVLHDKLVVSGTATLAGTLTVTETGTVPTGTYPILTATSISGTFSTLNLPDCYEIEISGGTLNLKKGVGKVWDGSTNTWSTDASWLPFGVPCPNDDVTINSGTCNLDVQPQMSSLTINGGELKKLGAATYSVNAPTVIGAAGTLNVFQGTLDINSTLDNQGTIEGFGTVDILGATVLDYGRWGPGNSIGDLTCDGTITNDIVSIEIEGGGGGGIVDVLEVSGQMMVQGTLELGYLGGTIPPGTRTIMECFGGPNCRTGTFNNITYGLPQGSTGITVIYEPTRVRLQNTIPIQYSGPVTWLGGTGNWSDQAKWSSNDVPNDDDDVTINAGAVSLTANAFAKSLNLTGGAIGGTANLTVLNAFQWSGGQLNGTGNLSTGALTLTNTNTLANGSLTLAQGGTINDNGTLILGGNANLTLPATKTLTMNTTTANSIQQSGSGNSITNLGTLLKNGAGTFTINPPFTSSGTTNVQAGALKFNGSFNNTGGTVKGNGTIDLTAATVTQTGTFSPGSSPGTLNLTGSYVNTPSSQFIFEIEENSGNINKDLLNVSEAVTLGGAATVQFLGGAIPLGAYQMIASNGVPNNQFASVNYLPACPAPLCSIAYTATGVNLVLSLALPVELTTFSAKKKGETAAELRWATASETNAERFDIQRSSDGADWGAIGSVAAHGTTTEAHSYSFLDKKPLAGINFYRLKTVDGDGREENSQVVSLDFSGENTGWAIFPNPARDELNVVFFSKREGQLEVIDWSGRRVLSRAFFEKENRLDLSGLPGGTYWLHVGGGDGRVFVKK